MTCTLYWTSPSGQADINMGDYTTKAEAEAAIPTAKAELLNQCGNDEQKDNVEKGSWWVDETSE